MWNRLFRLIIGLLVLVTLPIGVFVYIGYWVVTNKSLFDAIGGWVLFGKWTLE